MTWTFGFSGFIFSLHCIIMVSPAVCMVRTPASLHNEKSDNNENDNDDPDNENNVHRERGGSGDDNDIILPDFGNRSASRGAVFKVTEKLPLLL